MLRTFMATSNLVISLFYAQAMFGLGFFTPSQVPLVTILISGFALWLVTTGLSVFYGQYLAPKLNLGCLTMFVFAPLIGILGLYALDLVSNTSPLINSYQYMVIGAFIGAVRLPDYLVFKYTQVRI